MYDKSGINLIDRRELLRIKFNSLMAEAKIIRKEEYKAKTRSIPRKHRKVVPTKGGVAAHMPKRGRRGASLNPMLLNEMHQHRTQYLRRIARQTHIALGFIKGRTLPEIEPRVVNLLSMPDWTAIQKMVTQYGNRDALELFLKQRELYAHKLYGVETELDKARRNLRKYEEAQKVQA